LGIDLLELQDWNCCGSTSAHSINAELARLLPARNLEIAAKAGLDLLVPCAACYSRSKAAEAAQKRAAAADGPALYSGSLEIHHILDLLTSTEVHRRLQARLARSLAGLKTVCYYGCLTSRPPEVVGAEDCEFPQSMDRLVEMTGAAALPWSYRTECCGASLTLTRSDVVVRLVHRLVSMAEEAGAECIIVACTMCHANLDARQTEGAAEKGSRHGVPILYITELLGLAMDLPDAPTWWRMHLTDPRGLLQERGLI